MIFELTNHVPDLIQVTAQYSNAVLLALLPYFSDVAQKLDLPVPHPITMQNVVGGGVMPYRYPNGDMLSAGVEVQGEQTHRRWYLGYRSGHISLVELRPSYFTLQDPDDLTNCYGVFRMSKDEAIQMARDAIRKMGIPLELVFAEQKPRVILSERPYNTNTLPYYRIEWLDPRIGSRSQNGSPSVEVGINADARRIEQIKFGIGDYNLRRPPPKIDVPTPVVRASFRPHINPEYASKLLPIVLHAVDDYGRLLNLPTPRPLTTNEVARFELYDYGGWPHSVVELTNGWQFVCRNSMVNGFYAPDNLFGNLPSGRKVLIKDYVGKWNLTEAQAIALVKRTIARLNCPTNLVHMDFKPKVQKPLLPGIPRCEFEWEFAPHETGELEVEVYPQSWVKAEVDMDKGELKSLYYDDKAYWNERPPIDVPISAPQQAHTSGVPENAAAQSAAGSHPPRSFTPLKP